MRPETPEQILHDLADLLRDFNGREYSGPIGPHTLFFGDLGMVSIDAVVLAETLEQGYGRKFPFNDFLADLGRRGVEDLEVGELARFLSRHLGAGGGGPP
jgi:acyl carrier protein